MPEKNKTGFKVIPIIIATVASGAVGAVIGLALGDFAVGLGMGSGAGFSLGEVLQQKKNNATSFE